MAKETWVHVCPIHGEEICLAEKIPTEQVHMCRSGPAEKHFWRGTSRKAETRTVPVDAARVGLAK